MKNKTKNQWMAQLNNVSKVFNASRKQTTVLSNVSLNVQAGEMILLLGPSGSGKTTLLTMMAGLQEPTRGEVRLFDKEIKAYSGRELQKLRANRIGFIFQTFLLLDSLSVIENVILVMRFSGSGKKKARNAAQNFLNRFEVGHLAHQNPKSLSQGEKQRVAVARAMANGAELIIADEPTGSLATGQGMMIIKFLKEIVKEENRCAIIASHDERIAAYADRVFKIRDGNVEEVSGHSL